MCRVESRVGFDMEKKRRIKSEDKTPYRLLRTSHTPAHKHNNNISRKQAWQSVKHFMCLIPPLLSSNQGLKALLTSFPHVFRSCFGTSFFVLDLKFGYFTLTDWYWRHYLHINVRSLICIQINLDKMLKMSQ